MNIGLEECSRKKKSRQVDYFPETFDKHVHISESEKIRKMENEFEESSTKRKKKKSRKVDYSYPEDMKLEPIKSELEKTRNIESHSKESSRKRKKKKSGQVDYFPGDMQIELMESESDRTRKISSEFEESYKKIKENKSRLKECQREKSKMNLAESVGTKHSNIHKEHVFLVGSTKKTKFIPDSADLNFCGKNETSSSHKHKVVPLNLDNIINKVNDNNDNDFHSSSPHKKKKVPGENIIDKVSNNIELDHKTIIVKKKIKGIKNNDELKSSAHLGSIKKYVKREIPIDWQAVAKFIQSENLTENTYSDEPSIIISETPQNQDTMNDCGVQPIDNIDTDIVKLGVKSESDENETNHQEVSEQINNFNTKINGEMVSSDNLRNKPQCDAILNMKTKNRNIHQINAENEPLFLSNPQFDQFLRGEIIKDESFSSTPKKRKKNKSDERDSDNSPFTKKKKRRRLGDITVRGILNDYEQFINTPKASTIPPLRQEELLECLQTVQFESSVIPVNGATDFQKYHKYYSIYKSDSDLDELESSAKSMTVTELNVFETSSVDNTGYHKPTTKKKQDDSAQKSRGTEDKVQPKPSKNSAKTSDYNSDSNDSTKPTSPEKYMRGTILKDYRTSSDEGDKKPRFKKKQVTVLKRKVSANTNNENELLNPERTIRKHLWNGYTSEDFKSRSEKKQENSAQKNRVENVDTEKKASLEENKMKSKTSNNSVSTNYKSDTDYSDELTMPIDKSSKGTKRTILDYYKSPRNKTSENGNSSQKNKSREKASKKSQQSSISVEENVEDYHLLHSEYIKNDSDVSTNNNLGDDKSNSKGSFKIKLIPGKSRNTGNTEHSQDTFYTDNNHPENDELFFQSRSLRHKRDTREPTEFDKDILKNLTIFLPFLIPPLHENILYRTPVSLLPGGQHLSAKYGPFSKNEDQIIMNNWKQFCKDHNLDVNPCVFFRLGQLKKAERIKFLQYISHGLDNRLPQRVHVRFVKIFENMSIKRGRYSEKEDKVILQFMDEHGDSEQPFVHLGKLLNRNNNAVLKRYEILTNTNNHEKITWTKDLSEKLIKYLMKVGKCDRVEDLEDLELSTAQWHKISRKMDNMPLKKLQRGWKITVFPRLFSKDSIMGVKKQIFRLLYERKESDWRTVDWKEIANHFTGYTPAKVYNLFRTLVNFHIPKSKQTDLGACLKLLKNNEFRKTKKFRKFLFREGHLKYEDSSES